MTKRGGVAFGPRGHPIADFHLRIIDDDTSDESFHQLSALSKRQVVACGVQALTKRLNALGQGGHIHVLLGLGVAWPQLLGSTLLRLGHRLAFPLKLLPFDDLPKVQIAPPSLLTFALRQDITQRLTARMQGLG